MIPTFSEFRRSKLTRDQVRTFSYVLRVIALGRLPGEQSISRRVALTRFLAALILSSALWYYVTDQQNPVVKSQPYTLFVNYQHVPKGLAIRRQITTVTVSARGLQDTVNSSQQLIPVADLSNVSTSAREATVPITIQGGRPGVEYTSVPNTVTVRLEPVVSKTVPVNFNAGPITPPTLIVPGQDISPKVITVSGPADEVSHVASATVSAPTTTLSPPNPDTTTFPYRFTSVPILQDRQGHQITSTDLSTGNVRVTVSLQVEVQLQIKTLTVAPIIPFGPPFGYQLDGVQQRPQTVTVFGPPETVSTLKVIPTLPILLQNVTKSMTITTHLDLQGLGPNIIIYNPQKRSAAPSQSNQSGPPWSVYVQISKSKVADALAATVKTSHLGHNLQAQTTPRYASVYVTGPYLVIAALGPLSANVDLAGLGPGVYDLKPTVALPRSLGNYSISPALIHVVIKAKPK